jgi:hypothetical protein
MTRFPAGTVMRITGLLISGPQSSFEWNKSRQQLFNITARAIFKSRNLKLMGKEAEYRSFAALCLEVATKPTDTAQRRASSRTQRRGSILLIALPSWRSGPPAKLPTIP